ncbi:MAG: hypothetical protein IPM94_01750 [bacterium]|nr:hypothetical protein [bacterium]
MARRLTIGSTVVTLVILSVSTASATETLMGQLPLSAPFSCLNCHVTATPVAADAALNDFGLDFRTYDFTWDADLAGRDSDGDGCTNGAEVGDSDGNGHPDGGVRAESSNPGVSDCSASNLEEATWGDLKAMFTGR